MSDKTCYAFLPDASLLGEVSLAMELYSLEPGTILNGAGGDALSAVSGQPGWYSFTATQEISGICRAVLTVDGDAGQTGYVNMSLAEPIFSEIDPRAVSPSVSVVVPPAVAIASQTPELISVIRGDTLQRSITGLGDITSREKLWLAVKASENDSDDESVLLITEADGLVRFNGAAAGDSSLASLTVTDAADGDVDLFISETITAQLVTSIRTVWGIQHRTNDIVTEPRKGSFKVSLDIVRATS